jgi:hypothetical protein
VRHRQRITTAYGLTIGGVAAFVFYFALAGQWLGLGFVSIALVVDVWAYGLQLARWRRQPPYTLPPKARKRSAGY